MLTTPFSDSELDGHGFNFQVGRMQLALIVIALCQHGLIGGVACFP